jgi:hypothetical protein
VIDRNLVGKLLAVFDFRFFFNFCGAFAFARDQGCAAHFGDALSKGADEPGFAAIDVGEQAIDDSSFVLVGALFAASVNASNDFMVLGNGLVVLNIGRGDERGVHSAGEVSALGRYFSAARQQQRRKGDEERGKGSKWA